MDSPTGDWDNGGYLVGSFPSGYDLVKNRGCFTNDHSQWGNHLSNSTRVYFFFRIPWWAFCLSAHLQIAVSGKLIEGSLQESFLNLERNHLVFWRFCIRSCCNSIKSPIAPEGLKCAKTASDIVKCEIGMIVHQDQLCKTEVTTINCLLIHAEMAHRQLASLVFCRKVSTNHGWKWNTMQWMARTRWLKSHQGRPGW